MPVIDGRGLDPSQLVVGHFVQIIVAEPVDDLPVSVLHHGEQRRVQPVLLLRRLWRSGQSCARQLEDDLGL